jgi:hypothetical protein
MARFLDLGIGELAICECEFFLQRFPMAHVTQTGEVDIIEGVHDNEHNQVAFHTAPGMRQLTEIIVWFILLKVCRVSFESECRLHRDGSCE